MKKLLLTLSVLACAVALVSTPVLAQDKPAKEKQKKACGCCKDVEAQKQCKEACCTKAAEKNKVCKKCTTPGQDKKEEKK